MSRKLGFLNKNKARENKDKCIQGFSCTVRRLHLCSWFLYNALEGPEWITSKLCCILLSLSGLLVYLLPSYDKHDYLVKLCCY